MNASLVINLVVAVMQHGEIQLCNISIDGVNVLRHTVALQGELKGLKGFMPAEHSKGMHVSLAVTADGGKCLLGAVLKGGKQVSAYIDCKRGSGRLLRPFYGRLLGIRRVQGSVPDIWVDDVVARKRGPFDLNAKVLKYDRVKGWIETGERSPAWDANLRWKERAGQLADALGTNGYEVGFFNTAYRADLFWPWPTHAWLDPLGEWAVMGARRREDDPEGRVRIVVGHYENGWTFQQVGFYQWFEEGFTYREMVFCFGFDFATDSLRSFYGAHTSGGGPRLFVGNAMGYAIAGHDPFQVRSLRAESGRIPTGDRVLAGVNWLAKVERR